jgi:GTP-sensing pleiotropic transcriptional regulator CodY
MAFGQKIYKMYTEVQTIEAVNLINASRGLSISGTIIAERVGNTYSIKVHNLRKKEDKAWIDRNINYVN